MRARDATRRVLDGRRILVVEDDALIAMDLHDMLLEHGAEPIGPVASVRAALAELAAARPDAVLLDLNLRGVRSTPVAEEVCRAGVPLLLITGYSRVNIDEPAFATAPIVPKPVDHNSLVQALVRALSDAGE